jgi:hypothetical protein
MNQPEVELATTRLERQGFGGETIGIEAESDCAWYDPEEEAAYQAGRRDGYAYTHGRIRSPYPAGSILRERWWEGWLESQEIRSQERLRNGKNSVKHKVDFDRTPNDIGDAT